MERLSAQDFQKQYGAEALSQFKLPNQREGSFVEKKPLANRVAEGIGLGKAVDVFGTEIARAFAPNETRRFIEPNKPGQLAGATAQTLAIPASALLTGGGSLAGQIAVGGATGYLYDVGSDLAEGEDVAEVLTPGLGTAVGAIAPPVIRGAVSSIRQATGLVAQGARRVAEALPTPEVPAGIKQIGTEIAERAGRGVEKVGEAIDEAGVRRARIESAPPLVQNALKANVDDVLITAVEEADEPTKQAYRKMVEIAEAPRTGLRPAVRPESVAGDAVADQYKILDTQRKTVGSQIGDAVDELSKKGTVDVLPAQRQMRQLLLTNGIKPDISGRLIFTGSPLTPKQQTLVQQLYELSTQAEQLSPRQVYNMDKLFSQLQREARFDNLDNIYLTTPEGEINAFRAFRNIFSNQLDQIAPDIAPLNKQYAQLRNLQDDIEATIIKRGNYDSTRNVDPGEFAQTNLRRAFSDATSAADYRALADKLDAYARGNGYAGANPLDLAGFAQRLRNVYPETVPETSAQGLFGGGIKGIAEKILKLGAPDVTDQQKALKKLLDIADEQASVPSEALAGGAVGFTPDEEKSFNEANAVLGIAGVGAVQSVKKEALNDYIKTLEDSIDKHLSNGKTLKSPQIRAIMKALSLAAKKMQSLD